MSDMTQAETELRRELAAMTKERDEVRLRRQEMVTMCVQLEGEVNTLHQQLTAMTERAEKAEAQNEHYLYRKQTHELHGRLTEAHQEIARLRVLLGRWSTLYVAGPDVIDPGLMTDTVQVLAGTKEGG